MDDAVHSGTAHLSLLFLVDHSTTKAAFNLEFRASQDSQLQAGELQSLQGVANEREKFF